MRARDAEARAEALAAQVTAYHRREADRLVADRVQDVDDYWTLAGVEVDDLLDEESGTVDDAKVQASLDDLLARKPHLAREELVTFDGGAHTTVQGKGTSWSELLSGRGAR